MPELPDIELYRSALESRILGRPLEKVRLGSPFLLRTVEPPLVAFEGRRIEGLRRIGKRIVWEFGDAHFLVFHLMIAGRFQWKKRGASVAGRLVQAAFDFPNGTLLFTEAGKKKRAKLHAVLGEEALAEHDPGGMEVLGVSREAFVEALTRKNHTAKRALTDPRLFSGIGNSYSDEILFAAKVPPHRWTQRLSEDELKRLHEATQQTLRHWVHHLTAEHAGEWPKKVTAFHPDMAVHGRAGKPCRECEAPIQRIAFANNEQNYCANCQNDGKLLADRSLSRLLKGDWPKTLEQLEEMKRK